MAEKMDDPGEKSDPRATPNTHRRGAVDFPFNAKVCSTEGVPFSRARKGREGRAKSLLLTVSPLTPTEARNILLPDHWGCPHAFKGQSSGTGSSFTGL